MPRSFRPVIYIVDREAEQSKAPFSLSLNGAISFCRLSGCGIPVKERMAARSRR